MIIQIDPGNDHDGYDGAEFHYENRHQGSGMTSAKQETMVVEVNQNPYYDDEIENNPSEDNLPTQVQRPGKTENIVVTQNPYYE